DTEPDGDLDGRVELGGRGLLGQAGRLRRGVEPRAVDQLVGLSVALAALHVLSPMSVVEEFVVKRASAWPCHCPPLPPEPLPEHCRDSPSISPRRRCPSTGPCPR